MNGVVGEVEEAVKGVEDGEERWRDELREIRGEVESVRELVPRVSRFFFLVRAGEGGVGGGDDGGGNPGTHPLDLCRPNGPPRFERQSSCRAVSLVCIY